MLQFKIKETDSCSDTNRILDDGDTSFDLELGNDLYDVNIGIVQEDNLVKYTDEHFVNKLNQDLALIRQTILGQEDYRFKGLKEKEKKGHIFDDSNSPISMSNDNSDIEDDNDENYFDEEYSVFENKDFKKLSFQQVKNSLDKYYNNEDNYSSELDILTTYAKGQKHLFLKAKSITQKKLNILMFPCLLCTAGISISAPIISQWKYNSIVVSVLNAVATFLISIIHYLKLESSCETFSNLAIQYDKIECSLEMSGNKFYSENSSIEKNNLIVAKLKDIEKKMNEIKETTAIFIPEELRKIFPIICHINIFSFIKRIEIYKKNMIIKFRDIKNEIRYIQWKYSELVSSLDSSKEKNRFEYLCSIKEKIKNELIHYKNAYGHIDEIFIKEIKNSENISLFGIYSNNITHIKYDNKNPVITEYLNIIFAE